MGNLYGQVQVGECYLHGQGVRRNLKKALRYIKAGVAQEDGFALYLLGECYETGTGVKANLDKALSLYQRAAQQNSEEGCYRMALFLIEGKVLSQDREQALAYCKAVSENLQYSDTCIFTGPLKEQVLRLLESFRKEEAERKA